MSQAWKKWLPEGIEIAEQFEFARVISDSGELTIFLQGSLSTLKIEFERAISVHCVDESNILNQVFEYCRQWKEEGWGQWSLFLIENSNYLKWLSSENSGVLEAMHKNLRHYQFVTSYDIVDVISNETPKVSFSEEERLPPLADED